MIIGVILVTKMSSYNIRVHMTDLIYGLMAWEHCNSNDNSYIMHGCKCFVCPMSSDMHANIYIILHLN